MALEFAPDDVSGSVASSDEQPLVITTGITKRPTTITRFTNCFIFGFSFT